MTEKELTTSGINSWRFPNTTGHVLPCLLPLRVSFCPRGGERRKVERCSNPEVTGIGMSFGKSTVISPFSRAFETCPDLSKYEMTQWVFPEEFGDTKELGHLTALLPLFFPPTPLSYFLAGFSPLFALSFPTDSLFPSSSVLFPTVTSHPLSRVLCINQLDPPLFLILRPPSYKGPFGPCPILAPHYPSALGALVQWPQDTRVSSAPRQCSSPGCGWGLYNFTSP